MTFYEALPQDINNALYDYCKDNECLNDACLRALREVLKIKSDEPNRYSHDCLRCDKCNDLKISDEYIIRTLESKVEKLKEDLRNKRISIKNKKSEIKLLGERCNQLLKDKGNLTDKCRSLEEVVKEYIRIKTDCFDNEDDMFIAERDLLENAISVLKGVEEK